MNFWTQFAICWPFCASKSTSISSPYSDDTQERIEKQLKLEKLREERLKREEKERERANHGGRFFQDYSKIKVC